MRAVAPSTRSGAGCVLFGVRVVSGERVELPGPRVAEGARHGAKRGQPAQPYPPEPSAAGYGHTTVHRAGSRHQNRPTAPDTDYGSGGRSVPSPGGAAQSCGPPPCSSVSMTSVASASGSCAAGSCSVPGLFRASLRA
jgi:hypothetical protein